MVLTSVNKWNIRFPSPARHSLRRKKGLLIDKKQYGINRQTTRSPKVRQLQFLSKKAVQEKQYYTTNAAKHNYSKCDYTGRQPQRTIARRSKRYQNVVVAIASKTCITGLINHVTIKVAIFRWAALRFLRSSVSVR